MRLLKFCLFSGVFFCLYTHVATANNLQQRLFSLQNQQPAAYSSVKSSGEVSLDKAQRLMDLGQYAEVSALLAEMKFPKTDEGRGLYQYLDGLASVRQNDIKAAQKRFKRWRGDSPLRAYLGLNIGVSLSDADKLEESQQWLSKTIALELPQSEEWFALKDRANVYLGGVYNFLAKPAKARQALKRVRLDGADARGALLSLGWTDIALSQPQNALAPWMYLSEQNASDALVQEALLLVPFALNRLKAHGKAADSLSQAIRIYDVETERLKNALDASQKKRLLTKLDEQYAAYGQSLPLLMRMAFGQSLNQYIIRFMKDTSFAQLMQGYYATMKMQGNPAAQSLKNDYATQINQQLRTRFVAEIERLSGYKNHANFSLAESYQRLANQAGGIQ